MRTYLITYDLHKPGQNYQGLYDTIKETANGWWHHVDSTWLINTNERASNVRDGLMSHLDENDELLVIAVGSNWASYGISKKGNEWLRNNLKTATKA